ncbi:MAG: Gfo/Idh/MocA family oxidoreductase [Lentisphaerae bacterium]|nr:Gfo/Idh/MocA family oxidoreductase [Lentisphaerota bacterium]MBT5605664.1 Gfo/Idh/MocA family oxidoreductase [Lentisphaerota bacterium]MBT7056317.1 Gfo/Idh/MocA family oxidoreductase [Lentisphaerota bacterium]MBT7843644.1 Gfo/Idh/MocA family oxidoreductase [Lentisphaerota bacterium]
MKEDKIRVAVVGLGFGAEFVPIYLAHPDVASVTICDGNATRLSGVAERFGIKETFADIGEVIQSEEIDAVHLVSGIPDHAKHALAVMASGKHCACTVPMATSLEDLQAIVDLQRKSGLNYMMMETAVYTRPFLYAMELRDNGEFGRVQFLRGAHYQDMEGWPPYWAGLPPMWYATHAISPLLALAKSRAVKVHCFGSGEMREELRKPYGNPYPVEAAIFKLESPGLSVEVTRSLYHCARPYMESFTVYGEDACYEWQMEDEHPMLFRMSPVVQGQARALTVERPEPPDRADQLPSSVGRFTKRFVYGENEKHLSFEQGGGHHGSHPHMVHEFVRSIVEQRRPWIDAVRAAHWTAAGICAHQSAMNDGAGTVIPAFD